MNDDDMKIDSPMEEVKDRLTRLEEVAMQLEIRCRIMEHQFGAHVFDGVIHGPKSLPRSVFTWEQ
jgi:hypothetical protein